MGLVKNVFTVIGLGAVALLSMMLRQETFPELFLLCVLALAAVIFSAVLFIVK